MMNYMKFLIIAVIISAALFPELVRSRQVKCDRLGGNCMDGGEEVIVKKIMRSGLDASHRILQASRYISYDALKKNVPDKRRGQTDRPDNPYRRGCDVHSTCYRFTD
ncbi:unnamed protein product [Arabis nemorensis]|uniref:Uncharacterized protein n=1 Tax=Arabis nemorensis TaxID=586526 RepID=A0A565BEZ7_9BRAS|nr:unnamed protein product [Arabis nemorensis]